MIFAYYQNHIPIIMVIIVVIIGMIIGKSDYYVFTYHDIDNSL